MAPVKVVEPGGQSFSLGFVAGRSGLSPDEVVAIHSARPCLIYMMGFTAGFPYLGGMPERIAVPRLDNPRPSVPAGSVGIAGSQTGVYPVASPGGWRIIGRTPVRLYDAGRAQPILLRAGDYVKFEPVSEGEFRRIAAEVQAGRYVVERQPYEEE